MCHNEKERSIPLHHVKTNGHVLLKPLAWLEYKEEKDRTIFSIRTCLCVFQQQTLHNWYCITGTQYKTKRGYNSFLRVLIKGTGEMELCQSLKEKENLTLS